MLELLAEPPPSVAISAKIAESTGPPAVVQRVLGLGRFAYHAISAFGSIWILGQYSHTVTRLDGITGAVSAVIATGGSTTRLTATDTAVYVSGTPITRITPADNTTTTINATGQTFAIIGSGDTEWAAPYASSAGGANSVSRIGPDGTVTPL